MNEKVSVYMTHNRSSRFGGRFSSSAFLGSETWGVWGILAVSMKSFPLNILTHIQREGMAKYLYKKNLSLNSKFQFSFQCHHPEQPLHRTTSWWKLLFHLPPSRAHNWMAQSLLIWFAPEMGLADKLMKVAVGTHNSSVSGNSICDWNFFCYCSFLGGALKLFFHVHGDGSFSDIAEKKQREERQKRKATSSLHRWKDEKGKTSRLLKMEKPLKRSRLIDRSIFVPFVSSSFALQWLFSAMTLGHKANKKTTRWRARRCVNVKSCWNCETWNGSWGGCRFMQFPKPTPTINTNYHLIPSSKASTCNKPESK